MVGFIDPGFMGINITHLMLGLATLGCLALVASVVINEVADRWIHRLIEGADSDGHAFEIHGLGLTMTDGGERVKDGKKETGPDYYGF